MVAASDAVPVPGIPAASSACVLASVAVQSAFSNAASVSRTGNVTRMLIVPARGVATASSASGPRSDA